MMTPYAMCYRARLYELGRGEEVNYPAAIVLLDQASALNEPSAMNKRADFHMKGIEGEVNYLAAITLYDRAIALNNVDAMYKRARLHRRGLGCEKNYLAAIALYERADAAGCPTAKKWITHVKDFMNKDFTEKRNILAASEKRLTRARQVSFFEPEARVEEIVPPEMPYRFNGAVIKTL
ncbi:MAG: tetratricopeptide repeat protein [Gammaproteobacteria bacterium]|nr:tetratricopeptide repeat protein [Gammaproteobacteria bacterium]